MFFFTIVKALEGLILRNFSRRQRSWLWDLIVNWAVVFCLAFSFACFLKSRIFSWKNWKFSCWKWPLGSLINRELYLKCICYGNKEIFEYFPCNRIFFQFARNNLTRHFSFLKTNSCVNISLHILRKAFFFLFFCWKLECKITWF